MTLLIFRMPLKEGSWANSSGALASTWKIPQHLTSTSVRHKFDAYSNPLYVLGMTC